MDVSVRDLTKNESASPAEGLDDGLSAEIAQMIEKLEQNDPYELDEVIKESEIERTELVHLSGGPKIIRKYISCESNHSLEYLNLVEVESPYLPRIFEAYAVGDQFVVLMEHLDGPTLRELVGEHSGLHPRTVIDKAIDVCLAANALHTSTSAPIIHRDINPSNVICCSDGAKLIDFGIARTYKKGRTHDTIRFGTLGYAPPEQFGYAQTDIRTDVYALGMLMYFMLTNTDPEADWYRKIFEDERIPSDLKFIIGRCTKLDPADRYPDVLSLIFDLEKARHAFLKMPVKADTRISEGPEVASGGESDVPVIPNSPSVASGATSPLPRISVPTAEPEVKPARSLNRCGAPRPPASIDFGSVDAKMSLDTPSRVGFLSKIRVSLKAWGEAQVAKSSRITKGFFHRHLVLWRIWKIVASVLFWPFFLVMLWAPFSGTSTNAATFCVYFVLFWAVGFLAMAVPYVLLTNFMNALERINFFMEHRVKRVALTILGAQLALAMTTFALVIILGIFSIPTDL